MRELKLSALYQILSDYLTKDCGMDGNWKR
jgi:hypothetical protein